MASPKRGRPRKRIENPSIKDKPKALGQKIEKREKLKAKGGRPAKIRRAVKEMNRQDDGRNIKQIDKRTEHELKSMVIEKKEEIERDMAMKTKWKLIQGMSARNANK